MNDIKKVRTNKKIEAIIINKDSLGVEKLSNILEKYEELEVAGIINPIKQCEPCHAFRRVSISYGKNFVILDPSDIFYLAAKDRKVSVVTKTERYLSSYSLNYWEGKLKNLFFFRCHNSYLVNMEKIKEVMPFFDNTCFITFEGLTDKVSVSRSRIKEFRKFLGI
ncbi:LytTR family transcriptional regulator DNA-binding domain-containing protein [Ruminiclostridium herbifermentans]|uniref:LytTR family transcriptional regulator DNA-binding domain-containing protein n=1 Tax=Ruminiclostridium herbifermentans TaxID=2488810 RepID=A0A4U7JHS7_9FIRM|nr:LytTR family DNA-binding domain-containing protein [Ruminiclostridium herbifermentans]QNU66245.1 LytTR family transcriptional regulator DNA-binding domain-containing protein [Ruminiclostridium herbifermentans]